MRIFVAGATGAVGRSLLPKLARAGHTVTGLTRTPEKAELVWRLGAEPVVADALDAQSIHVAISAARPDVIIHELTDLKGASDLRKFDEVFANSNRLRTVGTDNLLSAARRCGVKRIVAQSFCGWPYARTGGAVKSEDDPLDPDPPDKMRATLDAIRALERTVLGASDLQGVVLRYGSFYGPGTPIYPGGEIADLVRTRRLPIVGSGAGVWPVIHMEDVALATALAIERGVSGIYNIVDDEPAPASVWLPELARILRAKPPRHVPEWIARLMVGEALVHLMTRVRGASNEKAKRELGWQLRYPTWRAGFRHDFASRPSLESRAG